MHFFRVLEAGKSEIKVMVDPVFGENSSRLQMAKFLYPHMAQQREEASSPVTLIRALISFMRAPPL